MLDAKAVVGQRTTGLRAYVRAVPRELTATMVWIALYALREPFRTPQTARHVQNVLKGTIVPALVKRSVKSVLSGTYRQARTVASLAT